MVLQNTADLPINLNGSAIQRLGGISISLMASEAIEGSGEDYTRIKELEAREIKQLIWVQALEHWFGQLHTRIQTLNTQLAILNVPVKERFPCPWKQQMRAFCDSK